MRQMTRAIRLLTAAFVPAIWAQNSPVGLVGVGDVQLCNGSFADANGTGVYALNPNLPQGSNAGAYNTTSGTTLPVSFALTLVDGQSDNDPPQLSIWFSPNGANYSDDLDLGFDACGLIAGPFSEEVNARGVRDDGSCYTMFDEACVNAIESDAQNYAIQLTLHPTPNPNSNLTESSLPSVCSEIARLLTANLPDQCTKYFEGGATFAFTLPLTGKNESYVSYNTSCAIEESFYHVETVTGANSSLTVYDTFANAAAPALAVYMPVANVDRTEFITESKAIMVCAHISNFSAGSHIPTLPPLSDSSAQQGLSGGAIAGTVVGVVVGIAIIAALAWWFFIKRKKARSTPQEMTTEPGDERVRKNTMASEVDALGSEITEMPESKGFEPQAELSGHHDLPQELAARERTPIAELEGSTTPAKDR